MMPTRGFGLRAVDLHLAHHLAHLVERERQRRVVLERVGDELLARLERAVGGAGLHLVRADAVAERVERVADQDGADDAPEERRVHLEADALAGRLLEAAGLLEQQDAEAVEAGVTERLAVLGDVRAEAARAARAGRDEHVVLDDVFLRHAALAQTVEVLHEVADGEVRRVALAAVAVLASVLERVVIRRVHREDLVADATQRRLDEQVVRHRQAGHEDRGVLALIARELARDRVEPVLGVLDRAGRGACAPRSRTA